MLVQVDAGGEGEVRANAHENAAPGTIVDGEVVLVHPALPVFQMPLLVGPLADADQDARGLTGFENGDDLIGRGASEIGGDEVLALLFFGGLQNRSA